ncbi:putative Ubiquitin-like domain-containing protein [Helianthus annuus]|uniref:Ubiquitin domain-containing protein n=2 Tax=Helianthus annuus TaxID=4232 RepID=A0A9K3JY03_HELAN|nr:polyubiquitin-B [Helianthus annuus]KAF5823439.1 putative Ubiquitin domain-containing protein [Helianthus annuus]KAJ0628164.1 putative Ubiquitin-like domain-containing protein [Helianthus annuus]KAJ0784452.1 putative Ubiquitin-like domain-containing protein [Helianthus annuus]KAJ0949504.1 putative Ubiquitin-like domain-containing protein [Helianthus annuus]
MADGSSLRKQNVPGNRKRKNPIDDVDDYSEADESDDCEIKVMTANGRIISLEVKELDTIRTIKLQIEDREGISCCQQELIFNEMLLHDTDTLEDLCIDKGSTLKLMRNSRMNIFVQTPGPYHLIYSLQVKPSDTIGNVKAKLHSHYGCIWDVLVFNEIVLDDDNDTLADFNIINGSTLTCISKSVKSMEIYVDSYTRKTISLSVHRTDTITKVKSEIEHREGIPIDEQVLIFNIMVLEDRGTILDFQINRKSTLTLLHRSRGSIKMSLTGEGLVKIFIKTLTGDQTITLEVKPSYTIHNIKARIQDEVHIPLEAQELIFNKMVLHDTDTLASYNINNKSTLTVMRISRVFMHIFIKTPNGKTITLKVKPSCTIQKVKSTIYNLTGIPHCHQGLVFNGKLLGDGQYVKQLGDSRTLADYDVHHESTIHIVLRLRGGMN